MPRTPKGASPVTVRVSQEAEDAVRRYLEIVADPSAARAAAQPTVDVDAIRSEAGDPLEALKAISKALAAAKEVEDPEAAFVRYAKTWADHNGVSREAFRAVGVKPKVLARVYGDELSPASIARRAARGGASRVSGETVAEIVRARPSGARITTADIAAESGAGVQTIRTVFGRLVDDGTVVLLGRDPDHAAKGPAPLLWRRV